MSTFNQRFDEETKNLGLFKEEGCSEEKCAELKALLDAGETLPSGYRQSAENKGFFYAREENGDISREEILSLVVIQQAKNIKTIKACIVFLTSLVAVSLVGYLILFATLPSMFK